MSEYKVSEPSALKFLKANGAVVDENGNVVNDATDYWKKVYDQAEPKVAKYLHSDGTIDENPGGGSGADLENNKTATIDVSAYTEPVEIEPSAGKDGMKKATITLSNIPSATITPFPKVSCKAFKVTNGDNQDAYLSFVDFDGNYITDKSEVTNENVAYIIIWNCKRFGIYDQYNCYVISNTYQGATEKLPTYFFGGCSYSVTDEYGGVFVDGDSIRVDTNASDQWSETFTGWSTAELIDEIPLIDNN